MEIPEGYMLIKISDYENLILTISKLTARIAELESKVSKTSSNSSKPPSSDGLKRVVKNNRDKSEKKQGAQNGHEGTTLLISSTPDKVIEHLVAGVCECGFNLDKIKDSSFIKRQEVELPIKLVEFIEHRIESKVCKGGETHKAVCELNGNIQYGSRLKSFFVYLNQYQFIPFDRLQQLSSDLFDFRISDGVLAQSNALCFENLEETEKEIKDGLINSDTANFDETFARCEGKNVFIHSASTEHLTHYGVHEKRGLEAMNEIGILSNFNGIGTHDRWASYDNYSFTHSLCNAHLIRDLKYLYEDLGLEWASKMIEVLVDGNNLKKDNLITQKSLNKIVKRYDELIQNEVSKIIPLEVDKSKRGRPKKSKDHLLLNVFNDRKDDVLRFLYNLKVSFDNNLAERDLRMVKLKQKISGCFRSLTGAIVFCRIRSYISSARKQGYRILDAIQLAITGNPVSLICSAEQ
jgi:hypothetical protein